MHSFAPAADQVGHVLAWLERAEERDVLLRPEAEAQAHPLLLGVRRRVEDLLVDPVVGDVELGGIGVEDADHLVASRLARHDAARRAAQRRARRRPEERALDGRVHVGLGEEGGVMNGDDDGAPDPQRHRVMR